VALMRFRSSEVAAATGGRLHGPDVWIEGATFDSRSLRSGSLFVPIVAARDGHDHITDAFRAGASAALTSRPLGSQEISLNRTMIEVDDTAAALMALAGWARSRRPDMVVGITGSVGKTSTKDLLAAALASTLRTAANQRSFNNEQGLPVTILDSPDDTEVMVLEMGMRGLGEIARLCKVARPSVGVVTVVGAAHTGLLGGIEGVARAKGELVEALEPTGVAVLNADDARVLAMAARTTARVLTYGAALDADVHVHSVRLDDRARPRFTVHTPWGTTDVELAVSGAHMALNAAAAIAAAGTLGVTPDVAAAALATATVSEGRMQILTTPGGALIVNDAYNANPTSMVAALDALAAMPARRRVAVLGLMAEIEDPPAGHRLVAAHAAALGIEVVAVGVDLYGVTPVDDPIRVLGPLGPGDVALVKGSLVAGLQPVAKRLAAGVEVSVTPPPAVVPPASAP
jgi:UDP-N-acetylmuramoyl-tripeptide--D-alanyl-D-alanine ligase